MKVTPAHYAQLKAALVTYLADHVLTMDGIIDQYQLMDLSHRRMCFDITYAVKPISRLVVDEIYQYANDDHLYTAMSRITKELTA